MEILDRVYRFIAIRPRTQKEITDYLKKKKEKNPEKIFSLLQRQGLIDDKAFVDWWLEQRASFRPRGKRALVMELRQKGISSDIIEQVLAKDFNELELAQKAINKKLKIYGQLPPKEKRVKLSAFLARNGFSWEVIKQTLDNSEG